MSSKYMPSGAFLAAFFETRLRMLSISFDEDCSFVFNLTEVSNMLFELFSFFASLGAFCCGFCRSGRSPQFQFHWLASEVAGPDG